MLTTLVFALIIVIGILLFIIEERNEILNAMTQSIIVFGIGGLIVCFILIASSHCDTDLRIKQDKLYREALVYQLDMVQNEKYYFYSKPDVIDRITEYNNEIAEYKFTLNNPWFNWFCSKRYVESLEEISIDMER